MQLRLIAAAFVSACALRAQPPQTAQTTLFRAVMPAGSGGDSATADVLVHAERDVADNILSGSVDFDLTYQFPNDQVVTGLAIVNGSATVIATNITASSPVDATAGSGRIYRQVQVNSSTPASLNALVGLFANPGQYSVKLLTADDPSGAASGALQAGSTAVLMALLNSSAGTGVATVRVLYTGSAHAMTSAEVAMQVTYQVPAQVTFSTMRVYSGQGQSGQIAVAADLQPGTVSAAGGTGVLAAPSTEIDMRNTQMVQAVEGILGGPGNFSVDVDTVENPSAPLTGQLRGTDFMTFQIPGFAGTGGDSEVGLHTLRNAAGSVIAGTVIWDVNYRLAAGAQITGLDLDGDISSPPVTTDPSGSGNAYTVAGVDAGSGVASLNGIVGNPEAHQIALRTAAGVPLGAALAPANDTAPVVAAVIPIVEVKTLSTFAPGELVEIYGTNLAKVTTDLSGWPGGSLPPSLNGVTVSLGGQNDRLLYVSPNQVDAELSFNSPIGAQMLTLGNGSSSSAPFAMTVASVAPALYNFAFKNADFSIVSASNPAHAGDVLVFYTTGMGQTNPALATGQITPFGPPYFYTSTVTATMGGVAADVIYSIASPPYVTGLYQMALTVPNGQGPGTVPVVATAGGLESNAVMVQVQ